MSINVAAIPQIFRAEFADVRELIE